MSKEDSIEVTGTVVEKFPSGQFSVLLDQDRTVLAHLAGKLRRKLLPARAVVRSIGIDVRLDGAYRDINMHKLPVGRHAAWRIAHGNADRAHSRAHTCGA